MEDFVTFNLAVELKEKGFNIPFYFFYRTDDKLLHHANITNPLVYGEWVDDEVIIAPTIEQVLKWLRNEKNMYIEMFLYNGKYSYYIKSTTQICKDDLFHECLSEDTTNDEYDTYEQAARAGIEYAINILI